MLVLTRKENESIHIGDNVVITIVKIAGTTVRVGVEAPRDVKIIRSELELEAEGPKAEDVRQ